MSTLQFAVGCLPIVGPHMALNWYQAEECQYSDATKKSMHQWAEIHLAKFSPGWRDYSMDKLIAIADAEVKDNPDLPAKPACPTDNALFYKNRILFATSGLIGSLLTIALVVGAAALTSVFVPLLVFVIPIAGVYVVAALGHGLALYLDRNSLAKEVNVALTK